MDRHHYSQNLLTRITPAMAVGFREAGWWGDDTVYDLARRHSTDVRATTAIRDRNVALSYGELIELADRVAARLGAVGLRPGDRVAAWLSSRVEFAVLLLACSRNGYVFCPSLHRNHTVAEIATLVQRMGARALYVEAGYGADTARADIATAIANAELAEFRSLPPPTPRTAAEIAGVLGAAPIAAIPAVTQADDIVYLAFTSGTTGDPKGVMHSNNTLLANARALARDWNFNTDTVIYTMGPLSHNLGFGALVLTLLVGGAIVLHDLPPGGNLLARLREVGATFAFGVPAHAMDLLAEIEAHGSAGLERLRGFRISGAAAPTTLVSALLIHGVTPQSGYGMTEAGSHHYTRPDDPPERITGTSGRAAPGYEVAVFAADNPNQVLPAGQIGQIGGRGASLMLGYFDNQPVTTAAFNRDGWFMTGDLGVQDTAGYLQITGRVKDIIIRGGHNIHPARIEELAMRHPDVARAAALPVPDERLGEKVCLIITPWQNNAPPDGVALLAHLDREGLSRYDMPEYFAVAEIPLGPTGKLHKRALLPALTDGTLIPEPIRWKPNVT